MRGGVPWTEPKGFGTDPTPQLVLNCVASGPHPRRVLVYHGRNRKRSHKIGRVACVATGLHLKHVAVETTDGTGAVWPRTDRRRTMPSMGTAWQTMLYSADKAATIMSRVRNPRAISRASSASHDVGPRKGRFVSV